MVMDQLDRLEIVVEIAPAPAHHHRGWTTDTATMHPPVATHAKIGTVARQGIRQRRHRHPPETANTPEIRIDRQVIATGNRIIAARHRVLMILIAGVQVNKIQTTVG